MTRFDPPLNHRTNIYAILLFFYFHKTIDMSLSFTVDWYVYVRMQSAQNLGLAVVNIVNGIIVDEKGYFILEITMLAWLCG